MGLAVVTNDRYYPDFGAAALRRQHGRRWSELMEWISALPGGDPHTMAFTRTIRHLIRSLNLNPALGHDPFCTVCASATLAAYKGSEDELLALYHKNLNDVNTAISTMRMREGAVRKSAAA